jgi:hypothetical protein
MSLEDIEDFYCVLDYGVEGVFGTKKKPGFFSLLLKSAGAQVENPGFTSGPPDKTSQRNSRLQFFVCNLVRLFGRFSC